PPTGPLAYSTSWSTRRTAKSTTGTPSSKASAASLPGNSPSGGEALESLRNAPDVDQQFALQPGWGVGREVDLDRIGKPAVARFDRLHNLVIGAACREDAHDVVRDLGRHLAPASLQRHCVQFQPELVEPVQ